MTRRLTLILLAAVIVFAAVIFGISRSQGAAAEYSADLVVQLNGGDPTGYARAYEVREFNFPQDHGAHPEFQTEWWYFTGNLATADGRRFGYQMTIFRRAITPTMSDRTSEWASNQVYFGDFAVTNVAEDSFYSSNRFSRGAAGLAGATVDPRLRVWLENWNITALDDQVTALQVQAANQTAEGIAYAIDLSVRNEMPIVLQGDRGLSQKNAEPGNASYYYSMPRLITEGTITINGQQFSVSGESWLDREWSTSVLGENAVGWDWFSLQLDNGRELMLYYIRLKDGTAEPYSSGTLIEADGTTIRLPLSAFKIDALDHWTSPRTGTEYPSGWHVEVDAPTGLIVLDIQPLIRNQELNSVTAYWEGASKFSGTDNGIPVNGYGYVELTGYNTTTGGDRGLSRQGE
ncbi:MAG: lipocalin-like domain-containing protein [Anaerolineae bacterium]